MDLMESPKCFRSAGKCWRAAITVTRSPNSSTRSGSASNAVSPRRTSTIFASTASGNVTVAKRHARQRRPRDEEPRDVQGAAVARQETWLHAAQLLTGFINRTGLAEQQQHVPGIQPDQRLGQSVGLSMPNRHEPHARRQAGDHLRDRDALPIGAEHHFHTRRRRRRRRHASLDHSRKHEDAEDGSDHADGIGHGVPNRGRLVADGLDRGLQRRRAGQRAGKHAHGVRR